MHVNIQLRFNPGTRQEAPYYRQKESYRDVRGHVHSLIILNIGFEPSLKPLQVKQTFRFQNPNNKFLFLENQDGLTLEERLFAEKYGQGMIDQGGIDRLNQKKNSCKEEFQRYIDLDRRIHRCSQYRCGMAL
ncbi:MAG: hypothetical protein QM654_13050 [Dysgonamonadaceae bacterium]